jgi:transcriptional regulator with XRE-family HTH domain
MSSEDTTQQPSAARASFARRLRELRIVRGYRTARSLARALDIDENRYTRYERAEVEPDLRLIARICETLNVLPNDLLLEVGAALLPISPGSSTSLLQSGLGERGASGFGEETGEPDRSQPEAAASRRRALAWQLARSVGQHGIDPVAGWPQPTALAGMQALQRTSQIFALIEDDPFGYVSRLVANPRLSGLSDVEQKRVATQIDELMSAAAE